MPPKTRKKRIVGLLRASKNGMEPVFQLRAQDTLAPEIVREWAYRAKVAGSPAKKVAEARKIAERMENWQIANSRKVPD